MNFTDSDILSTSLRRVTTNRGAAAILFIELNVPFALDDVVSNNDAIYRTAMEGTCFKYSSYPYATGSQSEFYLTLTAVSDQLTVDNNMTIQRISNGLSILATTDSTQHDASTQYTTEPTRGTFNVYALCIIKSSDGKYAFGYYTITDRKSGRYQTFTATVSMSSGDLGYYTVIVTEEDELRLNFTAVCSSKATDIYNHSEPFMENEDPYSPGGESEEGGGDGDFTIGDGSIDVPDLPTLSATDTGFITLFNPTLTQLKSLANYMWSSGFDLDTLKKLFADPMDAILGLSIVPVAVPNGGASSVKIGNIDTGVSMIKAASQYVAVNCGSCSINKYSGSAMDYSPHTRASIYLPYIGMRQLDIDDIMGQTVTVTYHVDILSGACVAFIECGSRGVLYSYAGQCSASIPITGNDWTNMINGVLSIAGAIGTTVATGGAAAPMAAMTIASTAVNSLKPQIERSGAISGMAGMLDVQQPYIILTRPKLAVPNNANKETGYPAFIRKQLDNISGYNEIYRIRLHNLPVTGAELNEIKALLMEGVIL